MNPRQWMFRGTPGMDLLPSYMAGSFVRSGHPELLMDYPSAVNFQAHLRRVEGLEQHGRTGPWLNPPFYAWLFVPLAGMPFRSALWVWFGFNCLMAGLAIVLLCRLLPRGGAGWRRWGLVPLLVIASMPFIQTMASQQNTFISLLILTGAVTFWRKGRGLPAGMIAGLLLFKPQLALAVAGVMVLDLGGRALLGVSVTAAGLLCITLVSLPGTMTAYIHGLSSVLPWLKAGAHYPWDRQMTFQGFWRLLLQGPVTGASSVRVQALWMSCAVISGAALALAVCRAWPRRRDPRSRDRLIAATIAAMPLLSPYFMDYDLLLLAVPAVLFACDWCFSDSPRSWVDQITVAGWVILFPWLFLNSAVASATRISITVPLLAMLLSLLILRACRAPVVALCANDQPATWAQAA